MVIFGLRQSCRNVRQNTNKGIGQRGVLPVITWILHESEAFISKALKGEAIVHYAEPLITQQMKASSSPEG